MKSRILLRNIHGNSIFRD